MSWSAGFIDALSAATVDLDFIVERLEARTEPGAEWRAATSRRLVGPTDDSIVVDRSRGWGIREDGQELAPSSWTSTAGAFSFEVAISEAQVLAGQSLLTKIVRGTVLVLRAGLRSWEASRFERIAIGQVQSITRIGSEPVYTVTCWDVWTGMRGNFSTTILGLYQDVGSTITTTLTGPYTIGDSTLTVNSNTAFKRDSSGYWGLKVIPFDGSDAFYLLASAKPTGTTFTIYEPSSEHMGTTRVNAAISSTVQYIAYLEGHPIDLIRRTLVSKEASNGSYDTLPGHWGYGLPDHLLSHADIDQFKATITCSGSHVWEMAVEEVVDDGYSFWSGLLSQAGIFLAIRQGAITIRCAQDPIGTSSTLVVSGITITDDDVERVLTWERYDSGSGVEYQYARVVTATSTSSYNKEVGTLPAVRTRDFDLSYVVWSNEANVQAEVLDRVYESVTRVPERLSLLCAGLRLAQLAVGDLVDLDLGQSRRAFGATEAAYGSSAYRPSYRRALVVRVNRIWLEARVQVDLFLYPTVEAPYGG